MVKRRQSRWNALWVAFSALLGILSMGDAARACNDTKAPKSCCDSAPAVDCKCCGFSDSFASPTWATQTQGVGWSVTSLSLEIEHLDQGNSCECRSNNPVAPASKPVSSSSDESRSDQGNEEVIAYLDFMPQPLIPSSGPESQNDGTPKCPVYLRTLRLIV